MFPGPGMVAAGVVGHPVEDHLEAFFMSGRQEVVEIFQRTEFRIDGAIVLHGIIAAERPLASLDADRMDRHQPEDVDTQFRKAVELRLDGREGAFRRELTHVDLVDHGVADPVRVADLREIDFRRRMLASGQAQEEKR